ncbi:MAG: alpha-amylase family glycosyl hydrolase, partial [Candidatus Omnitrophota bacterium]
MKTNNNRQDSFKLQPFDLGANRMAPGIYLFKVWAPRCQKVRLKLFRPEGDIVLDMDSGEDGYFSRQVSMVSEGMRYCYILDNGCERPDPAARSMPVSPHGPSEVVDPDSFAWTDRRWKGIHLPGQIFYEVHIGTFTAEGTFEAAIRRIPYLGKLGITCVEVMPVARFPGNRNWGYDGTGLYAVHPGYGGPQGLKEFVNACHQSGIAVCLDAVYNHLGPEGNYLREFGPYFTGRYQVPWGEAVNFDGWDCGPVR